MLRMVFFFLVAISGSALSATLDDLILQKKSAVEAKLNADVNLANASEAIDTVIFYSETIVELEKIKLVTINPAEKKVAQNCIEEIQSSYRAFLNSFLLHLDKNKHYREVYYSLVGNTKNIKDDSRWLTKIILAGQKLAGKERNHVAYQSLLIQLKFIRDTCLLLEGSTIAFALGNELAQFVEELSDDFEVKTLNLSRSISTKELRYKEYFAKFEKAKHTPVGVAKVLLLLDIVLDRTHISLADSCLFEYQVAGIVRVVVESVETLSSLEDQNLKTMAIERVKKSNFDRDSILRQIATLREDQQAHARDVISQFANS